MVLYPGRRSLALTVGTLILLVIVHVIADVHFSRWVLLEWFIAANFSVALRMDTRAAYRLRNRVRLRKDENAPRTSRVLILGAGQAGAWIARAIHDDPASGRRVVGFLDDDPSRWSLKLCGSPVLGPIESLVEHVNDRGAEEILVAIPTITPQRLRDIVRLSETTPPSLTILPGLPQLLGGKPGTRLIRKIRLEDLLERTPVRVDMEEIAGYLAGERVLVTGAGGSIGSELCRQIAGYNPESLILMGQGEHSIFWIEREMREEFGINAIPVIGDNKDRVKLSGVFSEFRPTSLLRSSNRSEGG